MQPSPYDPQAYQQDEGANALDLGHLIPPLPQADPATLQAVRAELGRAIEDKEMYRSLVKSSEARLVAAEAEIAGLQQRLSHQQQQQQPPPSALGSAAGPTSGYDRSPAVNFLTLPAFRNDPPAGFPPEGLWHRPNRHGERLGLKEFCFKENGETVGETDLQNATWSARSLVQSLGKLLPVPSTTPRYQDLLAHLRPELDSAANALEQSSTFLALCSGRWKALEVLKIVTQSSSASAARVVKRAEPVDDDGEGGGVRLPQVAAENTRAGKKRKKEKSKRQKGEGKRKKKQDAPEDSPKAAARATVNSEDEMDENEGADLVGGSITIAAAGPTHTSPAATGVAPSAAAIAPSRTHAAAAPAHTSPAATGVAPKSFPRKPFRLERDLPACARQLAAVLTDSATNGNRAFLGRLIEGRLDLPPDCGDGRAANTVAAFVDTVRDLADGAATAAVGSATVGGSGNEDDEDDERGAQYGHRALSGIGTSGLFDTLEDWATGLASSRTLTDLLYEWTRLIVTLSSAGTQTQKILIHVAYTSRLLTSIEAAIMTAAGAAAGASTTSRPTASSPPAPSPAAQGKATIGRGVGVSADGGSALREQEVDKAIDLLNNKRFLKEGKIQFLLSINSASKLTTKATLGEIDKAIKSGLALLDDPLKITKAYVDKNPPKTKGKTKA